LNKIKKKIKNTNSETKIIYMMQNDFSIFLDLVQRNYSSEIFFDSLLSDEDLSKLLCTCRGMKEMILKWKNILPIQEYTIQRTMTDNMFGNMIMHYSSNIEKLTFSIDSSLTLFEDEGVLFQHLSILSKLIYLGCFQMIPSEFYLAPILSCFINLTYLELEYCTIIYHNAELCQQLTSLSLTRLKINESTVRLNGLCHLSSMVNLSYLELTNSLVPIEEFIHLSFCANLTYLDLRASTIDDSALPHLSSLIKLTQLKICGDKLSEDGLIFLTSLSSNLTYLKFSERITGGAV
jgi:hypothetical protein